ncbi:hypothetical protein VB264_01335 [Arcicella aquatica]|uniref:Oligoendopeptidase F n=1 Tax=Arcicella aquatica TaxID=217141 RepID=A0ABU5QHX4_9BACT|nr:hypothetical protein [Arcicella aquatica]MEA5256405.1 hypothetical protein [Arcicella aquatica]
MKFEVCHHENNKWIESLAFFADEVKYFQTLLEEVKSKNTEEELVKEVGMLYERFRHISEVSENLLIGIKTQERAFVDYAQNRRFLFDEQMELIHERQRSAFEMLEKDFNFSKHQLYQFLSKVL